MDVSLRQEIISAYGRLLQKKSSLLPLGRESDLPFPKDLIRQAIAEELAEKQNEKLRHALKVAFAALESFVPAEGLKPRTSHNLTEDELQRLSPVGQRAYLKWQEEQTQPRGQKLVESLHQNVPPRMPDLLTVAHRTSGDVKRSLGWTKVFLKLWDSLRFQPAEPDMNIYSFERGDYPLSLTLERRLEEVLPFAKRGNVFAQHDLALMYMLGLGVPKDAAAALKWLREAAEQGYPDAQGALGEALSGQGWGARLGIEPDSIQAYKWLLLAKPEEDVETRRLLKSIAREMTHTEVAEAKKLAREWRLTKGKDNLSTSRAMLFSM